MLEQWKLMTNYKLHLSIISPIHVKQLIVLLKFEL